MRRRPIARVIATSALMVTVTTARAGMQAPSADQAAIPDAEGTKLITTLCGSCHARGSIVGTHRTKEDWEEVLEWMIDEGAVMSDEEFERILDYLSVRYGQVAINTATAGEIRRVLELTMAQAERLVAARNAGRRFKAMAEVAATAGLPLEQIEARSSRLVFE